MASSSKRTRVFISYSHNDAVYLRRLHAHLAYYERNNLIDYWDDTKLSVGQKWEQEIAEAIEHARVCILLVSADFLASAYVAEKELPRMLARARDDGALIFSVILTPSAFKRTELRTFQAINDASRPLIGMSRYNREAVLQELADKVADALGGLQATDAAPAGAETQVDGQEPSQQSAPGPAAMPIEVALSQGSSLIVKSRYAEAVRILAGPILLTPENLRAWFLYGVALLKLRRYSEANDALERAFALDYRQSTVVKTVLVVDDDPTMRSLLRQFIEDMLPGYGVEGAADGVAALAKVADSKPALILLDYMIPQMDGLDVLRRMAARGDTYPVIFMSATLFTPEKIAASTGIPAEQVVFLHKPFSLEGLGKMLLEAVQRTQ